jgi:hypothetical protein
MMYTEGKMEFNPFLDFTTFSDDELTERANKLNEMISYYYETEYNYIIPQLQNWRDAHIDELNARIEKRRRDKNKHKESEVIFDNSEEALAAAKEEAEKDKEKK